ncbi:hypothetical protein DVH24_005537 [Malus domestica]|uniref:Uncharacterized protein n=1 Tax=Malus domestica TaxID=3750 RepID=A0A498IM87_MALDO|nr:hypothetical protein DVH24_005537 [Malus domestica]
MVRPMGFSPILEREMDREREREEKAWLCAFFGVNRLPHRVGEERMVEGGMGELMEVMLIHCLRPYQPANKIRIRVCTIWVTKSIGDDPQPQSLDFVFVDKQMRLLHLFRYHKMLTTSSKLVPYPVVVELNRKTTIVPIEKNKLGDPKAVVQFD